MLRPLARGYRRATPLVVFAVLAAGIALSAWLYLRGFRRDLRAQVARELSSIADFKVKQLVAWREGQQHEWAEFRSNAFVNAALRRAVAGRDPALRRELAQALRSKLERLNGSAALLLDRRGAVVAAVPSGAVPSARELEVLARALRAPGALLDEGEPGDDLVVAISVDARDPERGGLLVRYDTTRALSDMVLYWPHPASTAEPVLVRRDGDFVMRVTNPLHTTAARLPLSLDIPTTRVVRGMSGITECDDYRGVPIIAALRHVPDSSWHLSVKVDRAEVFAPGRRQAVTFAVVTLLLLTLAGGSVLFWWRAQLASLVRRAEETEKRAHRARFDALWSQANDIVLWLGPEGRVVEANRRAQETYGYTRDELRTLRIEDLRPAETRDLARAQLARVFAEGGSRFETVHRRKDGSTFPVEVSSARVDGPTGAVLLSVVRDISERHQAAAAARYQATLLDNLNDAVIGLDASARITAWAGAAERLYGYATEEAVGRPIAELLGGEIPGEIDRRIRAEIARTGRCRMEARHARKDGEPVDVEITSVPIRGPGGELAGFVAVHRDIGDRKRAEAEQRRLQAELVFADRLASIGTLAAGVAHEINNPLSFLLANVEYARQRASAPAADGADDAEAALREASEGARRIAEIVRGLRAFGRRGGSSSPGPVDVRKAVAAALSMVQAQARPRARLVADLAETPCVLGREHEVAQVALNLVLNAVQAIPEGRPEANEVRVSTAVRDRAIELTVRDTGAGIAPEDLGRIFDPFFTTKEIGGGSGLGLSICHGIVTGMRGTIAVESRVGEGTTFTVRFPPAPEVQVERPPGSPGPPRRGRILVLDDEELVCAAVRRSLEPEHEVLTVCDPRAATERLAAGEPFDLVLCDLVMPGMSGMDCFEELSRRRPEITRRMVFLTGGAFTPRARRFLEERRPRCVEKPFDVEELRGRIAEAMRALDEARG